MRTALGIIVVALAVSGCSQKGLMNLRSDSYGPDEFLILPNKELEIPDNLNALPEPTPGMGNRVDPNPKADAVAALGGNPATLGQTAVPSGDGALIAQANRYGTPGSIRTELAAADAEFRRRQSRGTRIRLFPVDRYQQAYRREAIDPFEMNSRYRASGYMTPTAPPVE
ncbi:MAG: DUF3035 domain-containing protein [Heliomarina sp.]|uniref:DUF3035 domain-containing protein n=1 Tax=Heliomarina TaxID=2917553 RepID=UPI001EE314C3